MHVFVTGGTGLIGVPARRGCIVKRSATGGRRVRGIADRHRPQDWGVRPPGRRHATLAGGARTRRAVLFRLALEGAPAGTSWHAVADEGDTVIDIATVIGRRLGLPVKSVPQDTYGPFGPIFAADQPATSTHTQATLGWRPTHPSLLADLENIEP